MAREIIFYTANMCGDCQNLKRFMESHGILYETRDIRENPAYAQELAANTGKEGVPYLVIDGRWVRGYDIGRPFTESFAKGLFGME